MRASKYRWGFGEGWRVFGWEIDESFQPRVVSNYVFSFGAGNAIIIENCLEMNFYGGSFFLGFVC